MKVLEDAKQWLKPWWDRLAGARIPQSHGLTLGQLVSQTIHQGRDDNMRVYAGNLAFRGLFALFAVAVLVLSILELFQAKQLMGTLIDQLSGVIPEPAVKALREQIIESSDKASDGNAARTIATLAAAVWALSTTARGVIKAMNEMYEVEETRTFLKRFGMSLVMSVVVIALFVLALLNVVVGPDIGEAIGSAIGAGGWFRTMWRFLRWPVLVLLVTLGYALVYYFAPAVKERFRLVTHGTIVALPLWLAFTLGFSFYANTVGDFGRYGGLAGVVVLILYMFFSSLILLLGAQINDVVRRHEGRKLEPTDPP